MRGTNVRAFLHKFENKLHPYMFIRTVTKQFFMELGANKKNS